VPKPLTLYTHQFGMGKKNKVVKLTDEKIKYINIIGHMGGDGHIRTCTGCGAGSIN
jgi:hypothetical protein